MPKTPNRPMIARCVMLAERHLPAAIILYRAQTWRPNRKLGDKAWSAKSKADIMWETGLADAEVVDGIRHLWERDMLQVAQHRDPGTGKREIYVRLTGPARNALNLLADPEYYYA